MTPPPPASPGLRTGNREMRRRAPVSDRPGASPGAAGSSLPAQRGPPLSLTVPGAVFYTGVGWAAETHAVCVMDPSGKIVARFTIAHSAEGLGRLVRKLAGLGDPADMPVAIERPSGRLVDTLLEAGHPVVPVSPKAIKTWRESEVLSGAKSDPGDAEVIAEYLRLRCHRLRVATPYTDETKALRTVTRTRDDVADLRVAAVNQLGALLEAHWPGGKVIFADLESRIALEFLTRYPAAASAAHLTEDDIAAFCRQMGYSGKRPAGVLLGRLRSAPAGTAGDALTAAVRDAVLALVSVVKAVTAAGKDLDRSVTARLGEHPDGPIFTSLPRSGQINAAQMLAEWGDCPDSARPTRATPAPVNTSALRTGDGTSLPSRRPTPLMPGCAAPANAPTPSSRSGASCVSSDTAPGVPVNWPKRSMFSKPAGPEDDFPAISVVLRAVCTVSLTAP